MSTFGAMRGFLSVLLLAMLGGCYSFTGSGLPSHLKTVRIEPIQDKARQTELADVATAKVIEAFRQRGSLKPVDGNADSRLEATLSDYSHQPSQYDASGTVSRFRVTVSFAARFTDEKENALLFESNAISGTQDYDPNKQTEQDAAKKALDDAVKKLVDNTISGW
jgi:hypothetical protein